MTGSRRSTSTSACSVFARGIGPTSASTAPGCTATRRARSFISYFDRKPPAQRAGVIDHMAFTAKDVKGVKARFDAAGIRYDLGARPAPATWQLFCHDPNGAKVELDFDAGESL